MIQNNSAKQLQSNEMRLLTGHYPQDNRLRPKSGKLSLPEFDHN